MTSELLAKWYDLASRITTIAGTGGAGITWATVFHDPNVLGLREDLVALLSGSDVASAMIQARAELHNAFQQIVDQPPPLSLTDLAKLGAIAAAERGLSYQAIRAATQPLQLFVYAMQQVWPYLEQLFRLGVLVVSAVV